MKLHLRAGLLCRRSLDVRRAGQHDVSLNPVPKERHALHRRRGRIEHPSRGTPFRWHDARLPALAVSPANEELLDGSGGCTSARSISCGTFQQAVLVPRRFQCPCVSKALVATARSASASTVTRRTRISAAIARSAARAPVGADTRSISWA